MLLASRDDGSVLLELRPERGIWGGLWCPPEFATESAAQLYAQQHLQHVQLSTQRLAAVPHAFTHFDLLIQPLIVSCEGMRAVLDGDRVRWFAPGSSALIGLPRPVERLLAALASPAPDDSVPWPGSTPTRGVAR